MLYMTHDEVEVSWRKSLSGKPQYSRHFFLVGCFLILNALAIVKLFQIFQHDPEVRSRMAIALPLVIGIHCIAGYYIVSLYRYMKLRLTSSEETSSLLHVSYIAFRIYLFFLGISFVILSLVPLIVAGF